MFSIRKPPSHQVKEDISELQKNMFHLRNFSVNMAFIATFIDMCAKKEDKREFDEAGFFVDMSCVSFNDFDFELRCPNWSPKFSILFGSDNVTFRVDDDIELELFNVTLEAISQMVERFLGDIPILINTAESLQLHHLSDNLFSALRNQTYSQKDVLKVLHVFNRKSNLVSSLDQDLHLVYQVPYNRTWIHDVPKSKNDGTMEAWWKRYPYFHQEDWTQSQLDSFEDECTKTLAKFPPPPFLSK